MIDRSITPKQALRILDKWPIERQAGPIPVLGHGNGLSLGVTKDGDFHRVTADGLMFKHVVKFQGGVPVEFDGQPIDRRDRNAFDQREAVKRILEAIRDGQRDSSIRHLFRDPEDEVYPTNAAGGCTWSGDDF